MDSTTNDPLLALRQAIKSKSPITYLVPHSNPHLPRSLFLAKSSQTRYGCIICLPGRRMCWGYYSWGIGGHLPREGRSWKDCSIAFVQAPVFAIPLPTPESMLPGRACRSTHFYDGLTAVARQWNWRRTRNAEGKYSSPILAVKVGESAIRACLHTTSRC
ncbi:glycoside hydrolase family 5 protein [Paxillus involutus ATCC 200175]|uniref:Glycoside hydrolase family 5 protein n=1 Tax=Paxillus involutus ATCC 200175 TaxID=664439 RepID=A0A0C9SRZ2_PAXIN|nr:glycoside hydrolase family 5 protein [Paxillus involutus ATCC 200175]